MYKFNLLICILRIGNLTFDMNTEILYPVFHLLYPDYVYLALSLVFLVIHAILVASLDVYFQNTIFMLCRKNS